MHINIARFFVQTKARGRGHQTATANSSLVKHCLLFRVVKSGFYPPTTTSSPPTRRRRHSWDVSKLYIFSRHLHNRHFDRELFQVGTYRWIWMYAEQQLDTTTSGYVRGLAGMDWSRSAAGRRQRILEIHPHRNTAVGAAVIIIIYRCANQLNSISHADWI